MIKKGCLVVFLISMLIILGILGYYLVRDFKRVKGDLEVLDRINFITEVSSDTGLLPVYEKSAYLKLLEFYDNELDYYLEERVISESIRFSIYETKALIKNQEKRIKRLNDFIHDTIEIKDSLEVSEEIYYLEPITKELNTLQFIFSCPEDISAIKSNVYVDDSLVYSKLYKPKKINSIVVPHSPGSNERIELGYIEKGTFKYLKYNI
jgi:hypothetical protein